VAKKAVMAITGLILIGFLLMHMYGNLKMFVGVDAFDYYAHWLKGDTAHLPEHDGGIMYPIMPAGTFIWVFRAVLLLAVILHMWSAITLWSKSAKAAGSKYQKTTRKAATYSARTMRYGGVIIALFLIFHLIQFTIAPGSMGGQASEPHTMVVAAFQQWWMVLFYAICMAAVCMHVRHGFWSAFTTLGANTSPKARTVLNVLAYIAAIALFVGFMIMPLAVLFGLIG